MPAAPSPQRELAAMFDESAAAYEQHWAPALNRHARDLVAGVPAAPSGRTAVDIAAGAGTLAPALRDLVGPGGLVVALDHSRGLLGRAPSDLPRVQCDAAHLPLRSAVADVAVLAFVLFLLPDARAAVCEAARVLRSGGWLAAATWGSVEDTGADLVLREEIEAAGAPTFPTLPRSDELTDSPEAMAELLRDDFDEVRTTVRPLDAVFDPSSALALHTGSGTLGWRFRHLDSATQETVRQRAAARLAHLPPKDFIDPSEVLLTTARRR